MEKRVTFEEMRTEEADIMVPIGTFLRALSEEESAQYPKFTGAQWYAVEHSPAGTLPTVTADRWIPAATGETYLIADSSINEKTTPVV